MVNCLRSIIGFVGLVVLALATAASAQTPPSPTTYRPGLGDLMTMTVQPRHIKLGLAGEQQNWAYAAYEQQELQEAFDRVVAVSPKWRNYSIADMVPSVVKEPMAALEQAIKAHDAGQFTAAYDQLTAACNTCHQSAEHGMIVIQRPTSSSFADQNFAPANK
jgi:hypothetical protein